MCLKFGDVGRNVRLTSSYTDDARYRDEKVQDCWDKVRKIESQFHFLLNS